MTPDNQSWKFTASAEDPFIDLVSRTPPVARIYANPEGGTGEAATAEIECKIDESGQFVIRIMNHIWTPASNLSAGQFQVIGEIFLRFLESHARGIS